MSFIGKGIWPTKWYHHGLVRMGVALTKQNEAKQSRGVGWWSVALTHIKLMDGGGGCAICLEDHLTAPLTSQCGHVLCGACWKQIAGNSMDVVCPVCRANVTLFIPLYSIGQQQRGNDGTITQVMGHGGKGMEWECFT